MVEHAELIAVVHNSIATSKALAAKVQNEVAEAQTNRRTQVCVDIVEAQMIASQLRITANLVAGFLEENQQMLDRISELVDRTQK